MSVIKEMFEASKKDGMLSDGWMDIKNRNYRRFIIAVPWFCVAKVELEEWYKEHPADIEGDR